MIAADRLQRALALARRELLAERNSAGHWTGELSSSALSTATAVTALAIVQREANQELRSTVHHSQILRGLDWLAAHQNADGGWGDTTISLSNISTTTLCWAAFGAVEGADRSYETVVKGAEKWLRAHASDIDPQTLSKTIIARYGDDRTFSVPILTMCALAGRLGSGRDAWKHVIPLPFELAAFPHQLFAALRLPVVSYALPALIAMGQVRHFHRPAAAPLGWMRDLMREKTLRVLDTIQPSSGGFLEATPLTSFVTMSLAASGNASHPVVKRAVEFLVNSQRADGSWAIDTNLATWVTTLSVNALAEDPAATLPPDEKRAIRDWLLAQQYRTEHPYTHAPAGGWAWTDLPGGVPDADDTAGALLALKNLGDADGRSRTAAAEGIKWLLGLQNRDGGIPTFCRGWGKLEFDRSSPDLTAHALRAWDEWFDEMPEAMSLRVDAASRRARAYLKAHQRTEGFWNPLWFGNQHAATETNPVYGTANVILSLMPPADPQVAIHLRHACAWLCGMQRKDGSFSASERGEASIEETALAVQALAAVCADDSFHAGGVWLEESLNRGVQWLIERVESGEWRKPSPIGFYFAKLWYYERLYPMIFTVGALGRVARMKWSRSFAVSLRALPWE